MTDTNTTPATSNSLPAHLRDETYKKRSKHFEAKLSSLRRKISQQEPRFDRKKEVYEEMIEERQPDRHTKKEYAELCKERERGLM
jgi:hypothetical protein